MFIKRIFDFVMSFIGVILISPLFVIIPLINKFSGSKSFFIQERIGKDHKPFSLIKFATMVDDAHIIGGTVTHKDDPRVTKLGSILRKTKINELPQLVNVLKGDMSFIGPRPLPEKELSIYDPELSKKIYSVKPGITGLGSLFFFNEEMLLSKDKIVAEGFFKEVIIPHKIELELWYVDHRSFIFDLKILLATLSLAFIPSRFVLSYISNKLSGSKIREMVNEIMKMQKNVNDEEQDKVEKSESLAKEGH